MRTKDDMARRAAAGERRFSPPPRRRLGARALVLVAALGGCLPMAPPGAPVVQAQAAKPYDSKILRLSEILGAVHYLRELCGEGDGQLWRDQMQRLIRAEGSTALRKARLTRSFNQGYQSYSRTYKICTATAKTAIERFLDEGTQIAEDLIRSNP